MTVALYPGSFDPVTNGHLDIVRRASALFDKIIIGVYDAPVKGRVLFSTQERVGMFRDAIADVSTVSVVPYQGLTVQFAREMGALVMVRGLRASSDFEYEFEMALMNRHLVPETEILFLMTSLEHLYVSSSRLKELVRFGANIDDFVPPSVAVALREKLFS